ncbi:MAG: hypothetical protein ACP5GY_01045 [Vulcanisaeta sp.]
MSPEARLALLLLEELELRGGSARLRYLKVYRMIVYWLGYDYAKKIIDRLVSTNYIVISNDRAQLLRRFKVDKSQAKIYKEAKELVISIYSTMHRPPSR